MRNTKTVTIQAASLEEVQARIAEVAKSEGYTPEETSDALAAAQAEKPGRDEGKSYFLTEMPVLRAEKWAARALLAMGRSDKASDGVLGLMSLGAAGFLSALTSIAWQDAEPLLDEMMSCVQFQPSFGVYRGLNFAADDVEELSTMFKLRQEVVKLHVGFFGNAGNSTSATKAP